MPLIQTIRPSDNPSLATVGALLDLCNLVWPSDGKAAGPPTEGTLASWKAGGVTHFFVTDENGLVLAESALSVREVQTVEGLLAVGALAGVCTHPDHRNLGLGASVVRAAFEFMPELRVKVTLFQTGVPQFYEKLGARIVTNEFHNGEKPGNPFWDAYTMIYPAAFLWPDGPIDLNGPGY